MNAQTLILLSTLLEVVLLGTVVWFFVRLKRSEHLLVSLQEKQRVFLEKININARLEQEMISSFEERQQTLLSLAETLEERESTLRNLLKQADELNRSPQFLRQTVLSGYRKGKSVMSLSRATGLSPGEIELIVDQDNG
ncbi:MAG: hypothetical protein ACLFTB_03270 [Desulfovibrionales bacterium]